MVMRGLSEIGPADAVEALMSWWALAGVDQAVGEAPVNWLRPVPAPSALRSVSAASDSRNQPIDRLPDTLEAFHAWLADSPTLPEAAWGGTRILPQGSSAATLMIIADMPDILDGEAGSLFAGEAGSLLDAMLAAVGLTRSDVYLTSLAISRPLGGMLSGADAAALGQRMRRHIRLAAPARVLLIGEKTSRALLAAETTRRETAWQSLNHEGGTVDALAIHHPRLLLEQLGGKAEAWRILQNLIEDQNS
jgi:DNA polymerase